jgi:hypothetical protein
MGEPMRKSLIEWWCRRSHVLKAIIIAALIGAFLSIKIGAFDVRSKCLQKASRCENPTIDAWGLYGPDRFYALIHDRWNPEQRLYYARVECLDFAFALSYGSLLLILLMWLIRKVGIGSKSIERLSLLPIVTCLADEAENLSLIALILANDPSIRSVVYAASFFTALKFAVGSACLTYIFIAICLRFEFYSIKLARFMRGGVA